jgi:dTDP-4-dehydrorhamnose 3,5-epimerase
VNLKADKHQSLFIPPGFAHGFQTLMPNTITHYCIVGGHSPEFGISLNPYSEMKIDWPMASKIVSPRDMARLSFKEATARYSKSLLEHLK